MLTKIVSRALAWDMKTNIMGKLKVTPRGISAGSSPGQIRLPSCTTSAIHFPIQVKRSSALSFFNCSPIGQLFSRCRITRDFSFDSSSPPPLSGAPSEDEAGSRPSNSINPTRRLVPPLNERGQDLKSLKSSRDSHVNS